MMTNNKHKWEIETQLEDNIDVISANLYPDWLCGVKLVVKIKDNNKKIFKIKKLKKLILGLDDGDDLHFYIHKAINEYIKYEYSSIFVKLETQKAIKEFNDKYSYEKVEVKYE